MKPTTTEWKIISQCAGFGNNVANPNRGAAGEHLGRLLRPSYSDDIASPNGPDRPDERVVSRLVFQSEETVYDDDPDHAATDLQVAFAQFLSHDMVDISQPASPIEPWNIRLFVNDSLNHTCIPFQRSRWDRVKTGNIIYPREQLNEVSSYIDGSAIYGPSHAHATRLVRHPVKA